MIIEVDDLKVRLIDQDDRQVVHIEKGDGFEPDTLKVWSRLVVPRKVALDVGAYTGLFSIIAAMRGAQAVAIEPMPANLWRLGINVDINKVHITIIERAASDHQGTASLNFSRHTPLTTGASLEFGIKGHTDRIEVGVITIDSLSLTDVAAIKIDVERHECSVLKGALDTIRRDKPPILIETLDDVMRTRVGRMLPSFYQVAAILDTRNTLFTPRL